MNVDDLNSKENFESFIKNHANFENVKEKVIRHLFENDDDQNEELMMKHEEEKIISYLSVDDVKSDDEYLTTNDEKEDSDDEKNSENEKNSEDEKNVNMKNDEKQIEIIEISN